MTRMGRYCKAYPLTKLRTFSGWSENAQNVRKGKQGDGKDVEVERTLTDDDILYVQENYTVTDGIFLEENVIFDNVTPEWIDFCKSILEFEIPVYESVRISNPDE